MVLSRVEKLPEKYTRDNYEFVYLLAMLGATQQTMADAMHVAPSTISKWIEVDSFFGDAVQRGRVDAKLRVLKAFHDSCIGYYKDEEVTNVVKGEVVKTWVSKWHAGNPWSQARFLSLRAKNEGWSESQAPTVTNTTNITYDIKILSVDELALLEQIQSKAIKSGND